MTVKDNKENNNKLGKEKVLVDKDKLLDAYIQLDQMFKNSMDSNLTFAFMRIEEATGLYYERTLVKKRKPTNEPKKEEKIGSFTFTNPPSYTFTMPASTTAITGDTNIKYPSLTNDNNKKNNKRRGRPKKEK
jgi:hypothetical protein